jgi:hypothetical protein
MNIPQKPAMRKAYHPPEIKDYGTISNLTEGFNRGHSVDSGMAQKT